jgi:amidase
MSDELHWWSAHRLTAAIRDRELSSVEAVTAALARMDAIDPELNAVVTRVDERALVVAAEADRRLARGANPGPLYGLPFVVKDLMDVKGIRTSHGSRIYADHVADRDSLLAERLKAAGAIVVGKANTPEFGAGSHTFNALFGATRNPYDRTRTVGGSSGGSAAAVAAGLVAVADGSDLGGSIRNPASFCNLVGLRPSPGRVPSGRPGNAWDPMSLVGPLARTVRDAGLLLSAIAGPDDRAPIAIAQDPSAFASPPVLDLRGVRIAWSRTVDGLPVQPAVTAVLERAREVLVDLGAIVEDAEPDLSGADEAFETFRALEFLDSHGADLDAHPDLVRDVTAENIEEGRRLTAAQILRAGGLRTELFRRTMRFLERYDLIALPAVQVLPFPVETDWVREIEGEPMERYFTWMRSCTRISATTLPALSVPAGFSPEGLPVGLQLVGRHRQELALLGYGAAFEAATGHARRRPPQC